MLVAAILVDAWRWQALKRVARETGSEALEADALHFSSDLVNSVLVLLALGAAALGYPQVDALVAIGVAMFIAVAGFRLAQRTVDDAARHGAEGLGGARPRAGGGGAGRRRGRARARAPGGRPDVRRGAGATCRARCRSSGSPRSSRASLAPIAHGLAATPSSPSAADPIQLDDETILERVMLIAARRRVPVHHVMVQKLEGRLCVSLDLEVDGRLSLAPAHEVASRARDRHPRGAWAAGRGRDAISSRSRLRISKAARPMRRRSPASPERSPDCTPEGEAIGDVHTVRVRHTEAGLVVNYHCRVDPALNVAAVHDLVDELERRFRAAHPEILRVDRPRRAAALTWAPAPHCSEPARRAYRPPPIAGDRSLTDEGMRTDTPPSSASRTTGRATS